MDIEEVMSALGVFVHPRPNHNCTDAEAVAASYRDPGLRQEVTAQDIATLERDLGLSLPDIYKRFIQLYGNTYLRDGYLHVVDPDDDSDYACVEAFYGIAPPSGYDLRDIRRAFAGRLPPTVLAIASSAGGQIVFELAGQKAGHIYWWNMEQSFEHDDEIPLAESFESFLKQLRKG